ncbi:MAG: sigma-70 family RNA polymerase sigma factor [Phycisphaerales bacterium]|nr:sigma-70 family RNA polymerase sigma factor [Phycisphaerales bacterium]
MAADPATEWLTTSTLLRRLRSFDDAGAWKRLLERFRSPVLAFARKLGLSDVEADDAAQEAFLAFVKAFRDGAYDPCRGSLRKWLFGIAYRQIANYRRKMIAEQVKRDERGQSSRFWQMLPTEEEASVSWDAEWERAMLEESLLRVQSEFEDRTYRAFHLVVRAAQSPDQAAQALGMSRDAVYVAKHRVLKRLREIRKDLEEADPGE